MAALSVITLVLLVFMLIFYAYLANYPEHDVSFFLSVGLILIVMNLCTNASGTFGLSWLYLVVAVLFLGLGFAVDRHEATEFYKSIGPWFKATFSDAALLGWKALSLIVFPAGIACYFAMYKGKPALARTCGKCGIWGLILWAVILWATLGLAL